MVLLASPSLHVLVLLAGLAAATPAAGPPPCATCWSPSGTWGRFPAFFHSADSKGPGGGFTEAALDTISRFPVVTLEKWQGQDVKPSMYQEDAWVVAAKQIKARNPSITVIAWFDSFRVYTASDKLNPDHNEMCAAGNLRASAFLESHPEYLLKNTSGLPALEQYGHCHVEDHSKSWVRDFWREMCLNMTASGVIDGCGADASTQTGVDRAQASWQLDSKIAEAWKEGHKQMMRETTAALGDGILFGKKAYEVGDYVNGALCEECPASNDTIVMLQSLTQLSLKQGRKLFYECRGTGSLDEVAAFLVGVGPFHYYGLGSWRGTQKYGNFSEHWMPGVFDRYLGEPASDGVYDAATSEWRRSFASGTSVRFNAETSKGSITWGSEQQAEVIV